MTKTRLAISITTCMALLGVTALFSACEIDSSETSSRNVDIVVAGYYSHPTAGSKLVANNTGASITSLDLRQSGDELEGTDNNGNIFKGTIGQVTDGEVASITLSGLTTSGQEGTISGTISVGTGSTTATMTGTWIEPSLSSAVYGTATVPENKADPDPDDTNTTSSVSLSVSDTSVNVSGGNVAVTCTASGGTGSYSWDLSDDTLGSISGSGASVTYTANSGMVGSQTVTVEDSDGDSDSESISQNNG